MREFFGFGGYQREPEGYFSWQHLTFVTFLMIIMVTLAVLLGRKNRDRDDNVKNRVLVWAAIMLDALELFKIVLCCFRAKDPMDWIYNLPLFLCSIQLIALPLAAFSKGRLKEATHDFVFIFGILGAVLGTYFAGNNYGSYPVLCFDNVVSGLTHTIAGFASLYIAFSGLVSMKKKNIWITSVILLGFCAAAFAANKLVDYNYMFLVRGDGTPYDILYNLLDGHPIFYPLGVVALFVLYIAVFYAVYWTVSKMRAKKKPEATVLVQ